MLGGMKIKQDMITLWASIQLKPGVPGDFNLLSSNF